jgi:hypothetical protein
MNIRNSSSAVISFTVINKTDLEDEKVFDSLINRSKYKKNKFEVSEDELRVLFSSIDTLANIKNTKTFKYF